jgi:hypothetical protein
MITEPITMIQVPTWARRSNETIRKAISSAGYGTMQCLDSAGRRFAVKRDRHAADKDKHAVTAGESLAFSARITPLSSMPS